MQFFQINTIDKVLLKKIKLRLPNNVNSLELSRLKLTVVKKRAKRKSFFQKLNFIIDYLRSLRVEIILEYFKNR